MISDLAGNNLEEICVKELNRILDLGLGMEFVITLGCEVR